MALPLLGFNAAKRLKPRLQVPLRLGLIGLFVLLTVGTVGAVQSLCFYNGQQAAENLANQLMETVSGRVELYLTSYLQTPQLVNQLNANAVSLGELDLQDLPGLERHLWTQLQQFESLGSIQVGNTQQDFRAITRSGELHLLQADAAEPTRMTEYKLDSEGHKTQQLSTSQQSSVRDQPWYQAALFAGKPTWGAISKLSYADDSSLTAIQPVYDSQGQIGGVFSSSIFLNSIDRFLHQLPVGKSGEVFIIEQNGWTVATSNRALADRSLVARSNLIDSPIALEQIAARSLIDRFGDFSRIDSRQQLALSQDGDRHFLQIMPFHDGKGLNWLIGVMVPEADFLEQIQTNTRMTLLLCATVLTISVLVGLWVTRCITRSIEQLSQASQALAAGEWKESFQCDSPIAEVQGLAQSFNQTVAQLQQSFNQVKVALQQSEERFQRLVSAAPGAIYTFVKRLDHSFYFEYVSPAIEAINELTVEQMLDQPALLLIHPDDQAGYEAAVAHSALALEAFSYEFRIITPSGKLKWLYASSRPKRRENGEIAWYGLVLDISDRKQAEEALRQSEERWQLAISGSNDGIWDHDLRTNTHYLSPRCMEMLGYDYGEIDTFDKWVQHIHPDDLARLQATFQAHVDHQLPSYACEYRIRCKDGHYKWLLARGQALWDEQGIPVRAVGSLTDITDRKQAEAALRQSEERNRAILSAIPDLMKLYTVEGIYLASIKGNSTFDLIPDDETLLGKHMNELVPAEIAERQLRFMQQAVQTGEVQIYEQQVWCQETLQYEEVRIVPSGENTALLMIRDITDRKHAEMERQQVEKALRQSEARFQKIAAASPAQIYILAYKPGHIRFEYVSPGIREIQELEPEQVLENPLLTYEQIHPDDRRAYNEVANRSFQTLEPFSHEWRIITSSGKIKWVQANSRPERQANGEVVWYGVMLDITERKHAEEALRQSEAALRRAQQVAHVGSWEVNVVTEQVTWSEESFHIFGWDLAQPEPSLSRFYDLVHPDDRLSLQQAVSRVIAQGGAYKTEFRAIQPKGSIRYVEARGEGIKDEQGQIVRLLGTNLDITERQQAEEALRQSEATKKQILKAIPDLIIWMTADGTCIDFIDGSSVTNLYIKADAIGKNLYEILPPNLAQARMNAIQQVLRTGEVQIYEQQFMVQDTTRYEEVRVIGVGDDRILVIVRDITDRKQAEAALLDSETRFRSAFWDAPIGMALIGLDDRWIKVNPMLCQMLGYSESELLSMPASALVHPDDIGKLQTSILQIELGEKPSAQAELRYSCCNGQMVWGLVNLSVVRDAQGQSLYYVAQIQDITERQAIDRIKNEFISIVSHELRTPLTAIRGFLGLLDTGIYDHKPDKAKHMIAQALTNSDRLVRLVNDILDLERLSSGRVQLVMEVCQAETLLQQAVAGVQSIADQAIVSLRIVPTTAQVWASPDSIIQTLTNLLSNAIKFSPARSVITLSAHAQADSVLFSVADQGRGIPADKLETIFGRFQQVDVSDSRQKGGTGLGLAICQSIVQQHGGNIWAESTMGAGSIFYFTLPFPSGGLND